MKKLIFVAMIAAGLTLAVGCGKDKTPETAEEAQKVAQDKLTEIKDYIAEQDMDKAEETLAELKKMAKDASGDAQEALESAVKSAESAIKAAEGGEGLMDSITGGGD